MDRAAIFTDLTRRNALRKANRLPLLDIPSKYARCVSLAQEREYDAICAEHRDDWAEIRRQVLAELRAIHGSDFGHSMGGRWAVDILARRRFRAYMTEQHSISPHNPAIDRGSIVYGSSRKSI
jgi:hypothetical protein